MCLRPLNKPEEDIFSFYLPDGSLNISEDSIVIPEDVLHHVDNVFLNVDVNDENEVLGFIYESGNEVTIVYTSEKAEDNCDPFQEENSEPDPFCDSDIDSDSEIEVFQEQEQEQEQVQGDTKDLLWFIELSQQQQVAEESFWVHEMLETDQYNQLDEYELDSMLHVYLFI